MYPNHRNIAYSDNRPTTLVIKSLSLLLNTYIPTVVFRSIKPDSFPKIATYTELSLSLAVTNF